MGAKSLNTHAIFWAAMLVVAHAHSAGGSEQGPDCKLSAASGKEASGGEHYGCLLRQGLQMKFHGNGNETLQKWLEMLWFPSFDFHLDSRGYILF